MIVWIQKNEKSLEKGCVKMEENKETKSVKGNIINAENPCDSIHTYTHGILNNQREKQINSKISYAIAVMLINKIIIKHKK